MKTTLAYSLIFISGLGLGYWVNIFFTNKSYHDLIRENKNLQQQIAVLRESESGTSPDNSPSSERDPGPGLKPLAESEILPDSSGAGASKTIPMHGTSSQEVSLRPKTQSDKGSVRISAAEVNSLEDVQEFLKATSPSDAVALLRSKKDLTPQASLNLNGLFSGQILFFKEKQKEKQPPDTHWEIEMVIEGEFKNNQFTGRDELRLFDSKGKLFSTSKSGSGSRLKRYSLGPDNSFLISLQNGRMYVQIYYFPQLERWSGHYFKKSETDEFEFQHMGVVHMFKR